MNKKEMEHIIPLRREFVKTSRHKRAPRAIRTIKEYVQRHSKIPEVRIGKALNHLIWKDGIKNPPGKAHVLIKEEDGFASVELVGTKYEADKVQLAPSEEAEGGLKGKLQDAVAEAKGSGSDDTKEEKETSEEKSDEKKPAKKDSTSKKESDAKKDDKETSSKKTN